MINGVYAHHEDEDNVYLLRFYPDQTVLNAGLEDSNLKSSWPKIDKWFSPDNTEPLHSVGSYECENGRVSFQVTCAEGSVDYSGTVEGDRLVLDKYSHINGHRRTGVVYNKVYFES